MKYNSTMNATLLLISAVLMLSMPGCYTLEDLSNVVMLLKKPEIDMCEASPKDGLRYYMHNIVEKLPKGAIADIWRKYSQDSEVSDLSSLLHSSQFRDAVNNLKDCVEYSLVFTFLCDLEHFDIKYFEDFLGELFNVPPRPANSYTEKSIGLDGVLRALKAALPIDELRSFFKQSVHNDTMLAKQMNFFSEPFTSISELRETKPYRRLMYLLTVVQFSVPNAIDLIGAALGVDDQTQWEWIKLNLVPCEMSPPWIRPIQDLPDQCEAL